MGGGVGGDGGGGVTSRVTLCGGCSNGAVDGRVQLVTGGGGYGLLGGG